MMRNAQVKFMAESRNSGERLSSSTYINARVVVKITRDHSSANHIITATLTVMH